MLQLLLLAVVVYLIYVVVRAILGGDRPGGRKKFPCATCRNRGKMFDDGVMCKFRGRETFKNETHISNCIDYERQ